MPATNAGNDTARLKASPSSQSGQQDPPAPPQSRRKSTPPVSRLARASQSRRPRNARQLARQRQIPIDRTGRTAEPNPPAVSSPEACPTPAEPRPAPLPPRHGRRPTTLHNNGHSLGQREATGTPLIAMHNANQDLNRVRNSNVLLFLASWRRYRENLG